MEGKISHLFFIIDEVHLPNMLRFTLAGCEIQHITYSEDLLTVAARSVTSMGICPSCGEASAHVHSYYTRAPQDLPVSGQRVRLILQVRRFRCINPLCPRQTFAEQLSELPRSARHTRRLGTLLDSIAVVLSGQAGSRLAAQLAIAVSPDTLLRRVKKPSSIPPPTPRVLGVDDFGATRSYVRSCKDSRKEDLTWSSTSSALPG